MSRKKIAGLLIAMGVAAWIPYAILKYLMGYQVPMLPFLTVHLMGVLPGSYLRYLERRRERREKIIMDEGKTNQGGAS